MKEILVAVDGSNYSENIVKNACEIAKKLSYQVTLIFVSKFPDLVEEYIDIGGVPADEKATPYLKAAEKITSKLSQIIRENNLPLEIVLESGNPADKIITVATFRKSSMIAIGLRGLHGIGRIRSLGSVSRRVLERATCPVLVFTELGSGR